MSNDTTGDHDEGTESESAREKVGEAIDTRPVINYSATGRYQYTVTAELTVTLPVADWKSAYILLMSAMGDIDSQRYINLDDFDHERVLDEDERPAEGCPVPNLPHPEEDKGEFRELIHALQNAVHKEDGHDPFEGVETDMEFLETEGQEGGD